jgi:hypothetical protein
MTNAMIIAGFDLFSVSNKESILQQYHYIRQRIIPAGSSLPFFEDHPVFNY